MSAIHGMYLTCVNNTHMGNSTPTPSQMSFAHTYFENHHFVERDVNSKQLHSFNPVRHTVLAFTYFFCLEHTTTATQERKKRVSQRKETKKKCSTITHEIKNGRFNFVKNFYTNISVGNQNATNDRSIIKQSAFDVISIKTVCSQLFVRISELHSYGKLCKAFISKRYVWNKGNITNATLMNWIKIDEFFNEFKSTPFCEFFE